MSFNNELLRKIVHDISKALSNDGEFPPYFYNTVMTHYNSYLTSEYHFLVQMYPIHFMHLAFFETYKTYYHQGYDLNSFSHYFIPHQNQSGMKYKSFIQILYKNKEQVASMSLLTNSLDSLSLEGPTLMEIDDSLDEYITSSEAVELSTSFNEMAISF